MSVVPATADRRFAFSGSALAFGGRIRRPMDAYVKTAASSAVPISGGLAEAVLDTPDAVKPFHYKDIITFTNATSSAMGDYLDPKLAVDFTHGNQGDNLLPTKTSVEAGLKGLNINQVNPADASTRRLFTAGVLQVHMTSTANRRDPNSFGSLGSKFEGITLTTGTSQNAAQLMVETDTDVYCRHDTKDKLVKVYAEDSDFRKAYSHMLLPIGTEDKTGLGGLMAKHEIPDQDKSFFVGTIVKSLRWQGEPPPGTQIVGNRLTIEGFGRIFFGEIMIAKNARRVTLLRFELGSPDGGDASGCDAQAGGAGVPPNS